jgi:hypothetical protein
MDKFNNLLPNVEARFIATPIYHTPLYRDSDLS